jgi:hypothetical protein
VVYFRDIELHTTFGFGPTDTDSGTNVDTADNTITDTNDCRTLVSIDLTKLLDKAAGKEKASMFQEFMDLLGGNWAKVRTSPSVRPV